MHNDGTHSQSEYLDVYDFILKRMIQEVYPVDFVGRSITDNHSIILRIQA